MKRLIRKAEWSSQLSVEENCQLNRLNDTQTFYVKKFLSECDELTIEEVGPKIKSNKYIFEDPLNNEDLCRLYISSYKGQQINPNVYFKYIDYDKFAEYILQNDKTAFVDGNIGGFLL